MRIIESARDHLVGQLEAHQDETIVEHSHQQRPDERAEDRPDAAGQPILLARSQPRHANRIAEQQDFVFNFPLSSPQRGSGAVGAPQVKALDGTPNPRRKNEFVRARLAVVCRPG